MVFFFCKVGDKLFGEREGGDGRSVGKLYKDRRGLK